MKNKRKEKPIYIDDGRSIADMSALGGGTRDRSQKGARASFREQVRTYFSAVRMMLVPMLITIGIISLAFLLVYLIL